MGQILVGISSWTEPTLIEGGKFYPPEVQSERFTPAGNLIINVLIPSKSANAKSCR